MEIGKLNRRPIFQNTDYSQDAGGGVTETVTEQWQSWAEIIDTGGGYANTQAQMIMSAGFMVTVRFDSRFNSATKMIYGGQVCKCESINVTKEGYKVFLVLRFSKTETWVDLS
jgi:head-tail adaptor